MLREHLQMRGAGWTNPKGHLYIYIYIYMCLHIYNVLRRDLRGCHCFPVGRGGKKLSFETQNLPCRKRQLWLCNSARLGLGQKGAIFAIYTHIYILLARKQYIYNIIYRARLHLRAPSLIKGIGAFRVRAMCMSIYVYIYIWAQKVVKGTMFNEILQLYIYGVSS